MATNNDFEKRLWAAADQLWANSNLKPSEFSTPVLGLIFLRYADHKFAKAGVPHGDGVPQRIDVVLRTTYYLSTSAAAPFSGEFGSTKWNR